MNKITGTKISSAKNLAFGHSKILAFNDYFFSNISSVIFLVAIVIYLYYMLMDYRENERSNDTSETKGFISTQAAISNEERDNIISKRMWKWTFLVMLFSGFFVSSYCIFR